MQGHEAFTHMNYHLVATEMLYALSHALRRAGQDGQKEREQACKRFEQLKMHWHLEMARKDALL